MAIVASPCFSLPDAYQKVMQLEGVQGVHVSCRIILIHLLNYIISIYLQETHFWTLCSNYYCGGLKLEVAATADPKYVLLSVTSVFSVLITALLRYIVSHTQNIFRSINVTQLFVHLDFIEHGQHSNFRLVGHDVVLRGAEI